MESLEIIFLEAREITDPDQRAAFVASACAGDTVMLAKVEAMLHDADAAENYLKPLHRLQTGDTQKTIELSKLAEAEGTVIGRYKLLQRIGEGGMGVVYMAEQREPVVRKVALKIIKLGMDTNQVVARFEAERQALALMDHPNIAKVLDGGSTETGRPYFVMELVQGLPLTQFCDDANLPTHERLKLFLDVCSAVQHAHQKGIIHRDLKPSNILVTLHGDKPVPKVIDFGVAKATQGRLTDKTVFTQFQQFIGTPAYMSPEQASLSGLDVDTRSDIYALGVLLYELLTGRTPFDPKELLKAGLDEMRQIIREQDPPKPSTRLSTMQGEDLTAIAKRRHIDPPKLVNLIRGDLDWIVMKCLEKDRARRYETANGLAMDLQRHLHDEPVTARPPSSLYRAQKAIRRNKLLFAAAGGMTAILILGLTVSTWMYVRERAARERAVTAEREQARLRQAAEIDRSRAEANAYTDRAQLSAKEANLTNAEAFFRRALDSAREGWPDNPPKWEPALRGLVDLLLRQTNHADAETVLNTVLIPSVANAPENVGLLQVRVEFLARRGRWKEAIAEATRTVEFDPTDYRRYHTLAPLLAFGGDANAYRQLCQTILARFSDTKNPTAAEFMAKNCLLLSGTGADPSTISNLLHFAARSRSASPDTLAINRFTKGLAEYRAGDFASAADWTRKSIATTSDVNYGHVEAYMVLAMSQYQLKQTDEAKATLVRGIELQAQGPRLENGDLTYDWRAWVRGQVLMHEARALIEGAK